MAKKLDSFQKNLLDKTQVEWSLGSKGEVVMDIDALTTDQFVELLGAGCFTYHTEPVLMTPMDMHRSHFKVAKKHAEKFVQKEDTQLSNGDTIKTTIVVQKNVGGLDVLAYPIARKGVDTGFYKIAWGNP